MSSQPSQPPQQQETQLALVESLMQHIETFQSGAANEMTYLSAMNALRDLHAYVKKTEKIQEATKNSAVLITIDGEEFFVEDYQDARIAIRFSDNYAFSSDTGDFVGVWNEETRTLVELPLDDEEWGGRSESISHSIHVQDNIEPQQSREINRNSKGNK